MSAAPTYELLELCDRADVTPRTVRYYIQQGLLPSPGTRGPGARYDDRHLDRLRLIRRLQREHLPLSEIRHRVAALDDAEVRALLEEPRPEAHGRSALSYVRDVLAGTSSGAPVPAPPPATTSAPPLSAPAPSIPEPGQRHARPAADEQSTLARLALEEGTHAAPGAARSTWERVELAPDVELHVRRPLSRLQNKLVDRLIAQARTLFSEEP